MIRRHVYYSKYIQENNCDTCIENEEIRKDKGCYGNGKILYADVDGTYHTTCPCKLIKESDTEILHDAYTYYNMLSDYGILPYSGGYYEQPAIVIDMIDVVNAQLREPLYE